MFEPRSAPAAGWQAAATSVAITSAARGPLAGYATRTGDAIGALDPLEANLLLVIHPDTGTRVLWISLDSIAVTESLTGRIREAVSGAAGVDAEEIVCVASHSHATPVSWVGRIHPVLPGTVDPVARDRLVDLIARAARHLLPEPATLTWEVGEVRGVGGNRHDAETGHDRSIGVLAVRDEHGALRAVLYDYGCHPTVLGPQNLRWSADWVGAARGALRERIGTRRSDEALPVLFLQGCAGDVSCRFHRRAQSPQEVARLGGLVADAVHGALRGAEIEPGPIVVRTSDMRLRTRRRERLASDPETPGASSSRLEQSRIEGQRAHRALFDGRRLPDAIDLPVTGVAVGGLRWLHTSLELYSAFGPALRAGHPGPRVIGYTNAYHSYLADPSDRDPEHYEALSSYFDAAGAELFLDWCRSYVESW